MGDDEILNFLNSLNSTTVTETEPQQTQQETTSYTPDSSYNPYTNASQGTFDDYSMTQNYAEEQTYNPTYNTDFSGTYTEEPVQVKTPYRMETPTIRKDETPVVNLVKTKHKIELQARMKIVIAMFSVIVSLLLFVSVYNFVYANKLKSSFADKQSEISMLQADITKLVNEYNSMATRESFDEKNNYDEDGKLKEPEYVEVTEDNTMKVELGEFHEEQVVQSNLPSGWFNKVCDFLSGIFS